MKENYLTPAAQACTAGTLSRLLARCNSLWASLVALSPLTFGPSPAPAAVIEAWVHRYNGPAAAAEGAVAVDSSGNVMVTGYSEGGFYTAKYAAADGALLWERRSGIGAGQAVALDNGGNVVVTGCSCNEYYTAKYAAADGALLWEQRYHGPVSGFDFAHAVAVESSGNVVVTGSSGRDYYTAKYAAADGALLWEKRYNGGFALAVAVDRSGNALVTGSNNTNVSGDYYTAKYAAVDGALLWEQRYNGLGNNDDIATAVAVDASGNVVVTGFSYNGTNEDYYTAKYAAADGALLWEQRDNGGYSANAVAVDASGNVVVTGSSWNGTNSDYYTTKYAAADGTPLWETRYNGHENSVDEAWALAVDGDGNVVVTGSSRNGTNSGYYTAKYAAANGALLWEKHYHGPANGDDGMYSSRSLALGPNGMVAVTGKNYSSGDHATVVYWENLPLVSITLVNTGIHLHFTGVPDCSYNIERAPAVTGPWTTINTQTAPASGLLEYLDAPPPHGSAFYRTVQP